MITKDGPEDQWCARPAENPSHPPTSKQQFPQYSEHTSNTKYYSKFWFNRPSSMPESCPSTLTDVLRDQQSFHEFGDTIQRVFRFVGKPKHWTMFSFPTTHLCRFEPGLILMLCFPPLVLDLPSTQCPPNAGLDHRAIACLCARTRIRQRCVSSTLRFASSPTWMTESQVPAPLGSVPNFACLGFLSSHA